MRNDLSADNAKHKWALYSLLASNFLLTSCTGLTLPKRYLKLYVCKSSGIVYGAQVTYPFANWYEYFHRELLKVLKKTFLMKTSYNRDSMMALKM